MLRFHQILFIIGCVSTAVGTLIGLPVLMLGYQDLGKSMIMLAPMGMLLMFTGLVVITLHPSQKHSNQKKHSQQGKMPD